MSTRRALLALLAAGGTQAFGLQRFGPNNPSSSAYPKCPVCRVPAPADEPELMPVVATVATGDIATLPDAREITCQGCGAVYRVLA